MLLYWESMFWFLFILGPYVMCHGWSKGFFIRLSSGFLSCSLGTSQIAFMLYHKDVCQGDFVSSCETPLGPLGNQDNLALTIAMGVTGASFAVLSRPAGLLFLEISGLYSAFSMFLVYYENFEVPQQTPPPRYLWLEGIFCSLAGVCVFLFLIHLGTSSRFPERTAPFLGSLSGSCLGSLCVVAALYNAWAEKDAYFLLAGNRYKWCSDSRACKLLFYNWCVLCVISLVAQYFIYHAVRKSFRHEYKPVPFKHPAEIVAKPQSCYQYWDTNLSCPLVMWFFLSVVISLTSIFYFAFALFVNWTGETFLFTGVFYMMVNAFCLWSIAEFFCLTVFFHVIRLICDIPKLPSLNFTRGLPSTGRTILSYCLLSKSEDSSRETFDTAVQAHLANLDCNGRISTAVVSVSSILSVVEFEMRQRDRCRQEVREVLEKELEIVIRLSSAGELNDYASTVQTLSRQLKGGPTGSDDRALFWANSVHTELKHGTSGTKIKEALEARITSSANHFLYLHRNCKVLKKPGQYQDLIVLGSTGNNQAYTYLKHDYGKLGREEGSPCFGFSGNVESGADHLAQAKAALEEQGAPDIELVQKFGSDPVNRYFYTMVLDSDTICPVHSIRKLIEMAEHPANEMHGITNANLAVDYGRDPKCTWHMWRNALMEVSTVNLQRGLFWIFNRVGFYGKGLLRNEMYIERIIGAPGEVLEALPVDILSHDTVEAKLLQPAINLDVTLYEDVARNPISGLAQSTRWMLGEVRNGCYNAGVYQTVLRGAMNMYSYITTQKPASIPYVRWPDVPCSAGAEYLSHQGFRIFHAGPAILLVTMFASIIAPLKWGLELRLIPWVAQYLLLAVVLGLFVIPKGFLILDQIPSCKLNPRCCRRRVVTKRQSRAMAYEGDAVIKTEGSRSWLPSPTNIGRRNDDAGDDDLEMDPDCDKTPLTVEAVTFGMDENGSAKIEEGDGNLNDKSGLGRSGILVRQLALAIIEVLLSLLLFSPELVVGCIRMVRGMWSQVTGKQNWVPQDVVEKQVEEDLSLCYVFKQTWEVFVAGVLFLAYDLYMIVTKDWSPDPWLIGLIITWILYPVTTYAMCLPVPPHAKDSWLWTFVMEVKSAKS